MFAAFAAYRQFLIWRIRDGIKLPCDPATGTVCDAHNPALWVGAEEAASAAVRHSADGVAFVFTECDPFWFLDIDHCREGNGWSATAVQLCQQFAGAGVEVSQSGQGLHIFGSGLLPPHGTRCRSLGLEFYSARRFVALTGEHETGDPGKDFTAVLRDWLPATFPPTATSDDAGVTAAWADTAVPEWSGPADDDDLIARMLAARDSVSAVLGTRASVADLWHGRAEVLAQVFPATGRPYDASGADAALAQHLAFWTGKNTARIRRLMERSALARDKWREHGSYLWRTISRACSLQQTVYVQRAPNLTAPSVRVGTVPHAAPVATGAAWMATTDQAAHFAGCVYVRDEHKIFVPDGGMLEQGQFRAVYGGVTYAMDVTNTRSSRNAWEVFTESQAVQFPKVTGLCFRPELATGAIVAEEGRTLVNTYVPISTEAAPGDVSLIQDHIRRLLPVPRDREIFTAYLAALVQYPGKKFQWCPIMQGAEGNGKTVFLRIASHCLGHRYTHLPNAGDLGGNGSKFTGWLSRKLLVGIEEITLAERSDILDALKPLITNDRVEIQAKGQDQVTGDNRANFLAFCNSKAAIAIGADKRRYCILFTAQQSREDGGTGEDLQRDGMDEAYFVRLYGWLYQGGGLAACNAWLRSYTIPDELNPATRCMRAPETSSTAGMLELSKPLIESMVQEWCDEGRAGFMGGWISSLALDRVLRDTGQGRLLPQNKRGQLLERMGYVRHPGLIDGRANSVAPLDGGKPRLWIKRGHISCNLSGPAVVDAYVKAQGLPAPQLMTAAGQGVPH